jgi:hypothetical protein
MALDLDVVVDVDLGHLPGGVLVGPSRERSQRRPVELPKLAQAAARDVGERR